MVLYSPFWRLLFITALCVCSYGFLKDVSGIPSDVMPNDKVMHLLVFLLLTTLWQVSFATPAPLSLLLLAGYGGLIELLQHYATVRTGDWWDWLADVVGILLALWLWPQLQTRLKPARLAMKN